MSETRPLLAASELPVYAAARYETAEAARACPRADLALHLCSLCGYVWNAAHDPSQASYSEGYNASLHHSPRYAAFIDETIRRLALSHRLAGRRVVEAGCGEGRFLARLAQLARCEAIGIDPSAPAVAPAGVRFLREPLGASHARLGAALALCRHALHYLPDPVSFLETLSCTAEAIYLEVPNAMYVFGTCVPWAVFCEHVGYFGEAALRRTCARAGLHVTEAAPCFADEQYLCALAAPARYAEPLPEQSTPDVAALVDAAQAFAAAYAARIAAARNALAAHTGRRVVLWGAAGRGATFLAHCDPDAARVQAVTDNNPARHGSFVPGTGHPIVAPEALPALAPDVLVLNNDTYAAEIAAQARALGLSADMLVL
ncbi:MAG: methyltransferase domain-containing protein [Rubricoccaceae bacterium]